MAIQGLRDTTNFVADQRPKNWREGILLLFPNGKAPLTGLTSVMSKRSVNDAEFNWWEKELADQRIVIDDAVDVTASDTTIVIDPTGDNKAAGSTQLKEGHLLRSFDTDEIMLVTADPSGNALINVQRGFAGTSAAIITVQSDSAGTDPALYVIGNILEEGSDSPTGINYNPTKVFNYTQIFRDTFEMTRTASRTQLRTGDQVREAKRETLELHSLALEKAFWFGQRVETVRNGKPMRAMRGVLEQIVAGAPDNVVDKAGVAADMLYLEEQLFNMFKFGSSEKMAFCGNRALLTINQIVRKNSNVQIFSGIKEFGMNVSKLISPFGEITLKTHPLFNQMASAPTLSNFQGVESWIFVLDMAELKYVNFTGADTKYEPKLESNGIDGLKSGYLTEASIEVHHPKTHYVIKGLTLAAADA